MKRFFKIHHKIDKLVELATCQIIHIKAKGGFLLIIPAYMKRKKLEFTVKLP